MNDPGNVRIFQNVNNNWLQIGEDIIGEEGDWSGTVSLNSDGSIVAIGAIFNSNDNGPYVGSARVYQNIGDSWIQIGTAINGVEVSDASGWSVSLSSEGSKVAIGAYLNDGNGMNSGHVRVFENINGSWEQIGLDLDGEAANDLSGWSVSLSSDGNTIAIGAIANINADAYTTGHVRVFENTDNLNVEELQLFGVTLYPNPVQVNLFINSVSTILSINIYDMNGRLLQEMTALNQGLNNKVDLRSMSEGVYFLKITLSEGELVQKIIKS